MYKQNKTVDGINVLALVGSRRKQGNSCTFYQAHRANPLKVALARLVGSVFYHFVV